MSRKQCHGGSGSLIAVIEFSNRKRRAPRGKIEAPMASTVASSALSVPYSRIREIAESPLGLDASQTVYARIPSPPPGFQSRCAAEKAGPTDSRSTPKRRLPFFAQALESYYDDRTAGNSTPRARSRHRFGRAGVKIGLRCSSIRRRSVVLSPACPSLPSLHSRTAHRARCTILHAADSIDFDALEKAVTPRTRLLLDTSPSNPLGWVATEQGSDACRLRAATVSGAGREVYTSVLPPRDHPAANERRASGAAPSILKKCTREDGWS